MSNFFTTTKFIIFGQSRSGTTLLRELLDTHPDIQCDGELLNPNQSYLSHRRLLPALKIFPFPIIYWRLLTSQRPVYGFKLLIGQPTFVRTTLALLHWGGWKIIYVLRRNVLVQVLSVLVALQTGFWHRRSGGPTQPLRLRIDEKTLMHELQVRQRSLIRESRALAALSPFRLCYEDHLLHPIARTQTLSRIFAFLKVHPQVVASTLQPTYEQPYSEIVENYAELAKLVEEAAAKVT